MKEKKGIGFAKLIIGIIVIIVVVIFGVSYVKKIIDKEKIKNVQADLLLVQAKIELVKGNYNMSKENNALKGYQLNQLPEGINIQDFFDKNIIEQSEYEKYYLLDKDALQQCGLEDLVNSYDGYFIVNYDNYDVIYTKGYKNSNGLWCYKISDLNKMPDIQQSIPVVAQVKDENSGNTDNNQGGNDSSEVNNQESNNEINNQTTENTENTEVNKESEKNIETNENSNAENDNNQNVNKNVIYDEINTKIKQTITIIKEKNQELSVLLQ